MANKNQNKKQRKLNTVTKQEIAERVNLIETFILQGLNWTEIWELIEKRYLQYWKVTRRTVYSYFQIAKKRTNKIISEMELKGYLRKTLKRYEMLFKQSQLENDLKTCNAINKNVSDLLQLNEYSKQILEVSDEVIKVQVVDFD